jgi:hypothetical protein
MKTRVMNYGAMLIALLMILVLSVEAYACACCSNGGEWTQRTNRVEEDYHMAAVDALQFGPLANTYMTEAGEDGIKGMSSVADKYNLSLRRAGRRWTLTFKDEQGRTGTLSFTIPVTMVSYAVDPHGGENAGGTGPAIYHEWRFAGPVTGTGIFKKGMVGHTRFHLVLQGTSNNCVDTSSFHNWNLQISGPRADYSFYGSFKGNAPENATDQTPERDAASNQDQAVGKVMLALVQAWNNAAARELTAALV